MSNTDDLEWTETRDSDVIHVARGSRDEQISFISIQRQAISMRYIFEKGAAGGRGVVVNIASGVNCVVEIAAVGTHHHSK